MHATRPLFPLGRIVATPGALEALHNAGQDARELLARHAGGDWGTLSEDDRNENGSVASFHLRELPLCFSTDGKVVEGRYDQLQGQPI